MGESVSGGADAWGGETLVIPCPFCSGLVRASAEERQVGHSRPACARFVDLDGAEFLDALVGERWRGAS